MNRLSIASLSFALVALAAPAARAQTAQTARITVCQDGTTTTDVSSRACARHRGVNVDATRRLRAQRTNSTSYGVYDGRGNVTNGNQIPCGDGTYSASGIHGCDARGGVKSTQTNGQYNNGQSNNGQYNNGQYNNGQSNGTINNRNGSRDNSERSDSARRGRASRQRTGVNAAATAKCQDGTFTTTTNRRVACTQHGGVATWYGVRQPSAGH